MSEKASLKKMTAADFRKELVKTMPGYDWTVHKSSNPEGYLSATGIQSSGFNRLSTLEVVRRDRNGNVWYEVKFSGYGKKSPWVSTHENGTLARALRDMQTHYENVAASYRGYANTLQRARKKAIEIPAQGDTA